MIDNSYSTPLCQQPLSLGIDLSVHSATKYLGGHSDTVGGVVCGSRELLSRVFERGSLMLGGVAALWNAWLLLGWFRTLALRLERVAASAETMSGFLENRQQIEDIY